MRRRIAALAVAGSIFAVTAAGASSLDLISGPAPAAGQTTAVTCTTTATVGYTASDYMLAPQVQSVVVTPDVPQPACQTMPALIKVQAQSTDVGGIVGYAYLGNGLGTGTPIELTANQLCLSETEALAENCTAHVNWLGTVQGISDLKTYIVVAQHIWHDSDQ
jgi:hypothetical protein